MSNIFTHIRDHRLYGWIIFVVAALNVVIVGGKRRSFGVFIAALHTNFNTTSMVELNWIGDSYAALAFFSMPFVIALIMSFNRAYRLSMFVAGCFIFASCISSSMVPSPGYLFITHTLLHGIGSSLVLCTTVLVIGEYFDIHHRFHVLATTFVSGGPYGVIIFGPIYAAMIARYNWRVALQIISIPFLLLCSMGALTFIPRNIEYEHLNSDSRTKKANKSFAFCSWDHLMKHKQIFWWLMERIFHNITMYALLMNLPTFVEESLTGPGTDTFVLSLTLGLGESTIFTIGAFTGDKLRGYLPFVQLIGAFCGTLMCFIMIFSLEHLKRLTIICFFFGGAIGVGNTGLYACVEEVMFLHGSIAFPMSKMMAGIGMVIAPLFSGLIIDIGGFIGFFTVTLVLFALRVFCLLIVNKMVIEHRHQIWMDEQQRLKEINLKAMQHEDCIEVGEDGFPESSSPIQEVEEVFA